MGSLKVMKGVSYTEKRLEQWLDEDGMVWAQPKRDEIRCTVTIDGEKVEYTSAQGKPLYNLNQFDDMWLRIAKHTGRTVLDTGVSVNDCFDTTKRVLRTSTTKYGLKDNKLSLIYNKKPTKKNPSGDIFFYGFLKARFWLYDLPEILGTDFKHRLDGMYIIRSYAPDFLGVPETWILQDSDAVHGKYDLCVDGGLEGLMIKRSRHGYVNGRSTDWMKMKPEEEKDGIITGFTEGQGKFAGLIGSATIDFGDGSGTSVSGMDDATRLDMSRNPAKYLGQVARIPYMQRDSQGGYRHPRWGGLHEDKSREDVLSAPN